ncbi:MAG: TIM44-like domain-containing protein, partial [Kordiimonadaceae bacterium]|nr:TIM44-like domain-containing protein [Kordiimonadaceae bacterium]
SEEIQTWAKAKENLSWKHIWDSDKLIARIYNAHLGNVPLDFLLDKEGKIIEGDASDAVEMNDKWTFARDVNSGDPSWTLVATSSG